MLRTNFVLAATLALLVTSVLSGCGSSAAPSDPESNAPVANQHHGDHHDSGADNAAIAEALAQLSPEDRVRAEKQRICPVTGELLGSMGAPMKVDVLGEQVFICCEGCKENLLAKPEEYLAKLKK